MANFTAADVKKLRDLTGAGMMDCKKALEETNGDIQAALEYLRVKGQASAQKRAGREAKNGLVSAQVTDGVGVMVKVACETDFVAKGDAFKALAQQVLDAAVASAASDVETVLGAQAGSQTVADLVTSATATIGEKIHVDKVARLTGEHVAVYLHRTSPDLPPQIGVLVATDKASDVARDIAMHAAAMAPAYLTRDDVPADIVESERRVAEEKSREEGKPEQALPRIVQGRVDAFFRENVLLEQKYAKDPSKTIEQLAKEAGVTVTGFARFAVGS